MRVCDIERGEVTTVELRPVSGASFNQQFSSTQEVALFTPEVDGAVLLQADNNAWDVEGADPQSQHRLARLVTRNLPRIAWVAGVQPRGSKDPTSLVIEVREFPSENIWPGAVHLGVDEKTVDAVRRRDCLAEREGAASRHRWDNPSRALWQPDTAGGYAKRF